VTWEESIYRAGKLHGNYRSYHDNGNLNATAQYEDGELVGEYRSYSPYGMPQEISNYRQGKWEGVRTTYYETGEVHRVDTFRDGRAVFRQEFDDEGKLIREVDEPIPEIEEGRTREAEVFFNKGIGFSKTGCHYQAVQAFKKAIAIKSDFIEAYFKLAFTYRSLGLCEEYMDTLKKVLDAEPDHPGACFHLAIAHIITGNRTKALVEQEILKDLDEVYANGLMNILTT
jgi:tetratricopeptide (TPR) repeat protein